MNLTTSNTIIDCIDHEILLEPEYANFNNFTMFKKTYSGQKIAILRYFLVFLVFIKAKFVSICMEKSIF